MKEILLRTLLYWIHDLSKSAICGNIVTADITENGWEVVIITCMIEQISGDISEHYKKLLIFSKDTGGLIKIKDDFKAAIHPENGITLSWEGQKYEHLKITSHIDVSLKYIYDGTILISEKNKED